MHLRPGSVARAGRPGVADGRAGPCVKLGVVDLGLFGEDVLQGAVFGRVVGDVVLPVPDDVEQGAGKDTDGVGVVVASVAGTLVELVTPGVGSAGVAGEIGDGVSELFSQAQPKPTARILPDCLPKISTQRPTRTTVA
jgi:hypothetical protein